MVLESLKKQGFSPRKRRVSITGGDPLDPEHREGLKELIQVLKDNGAWVNIEAAGNVVDHEILTPLISSVSISKLHRPKS